MLELLGLGNQQIVQELGDLIQAQDPAIVFLAKTWLFKAKVGDIGDRLQMGDYFRVSKITNGGGLALFLKEKKKVLRWMLNFPL